MTRRPPEDFDLLITALDTIEKVEVAWLLYSTGRSMTTTELLELSSPSPSEIFAASLDDLIRSEIVRHDSPTSFVLGSRAQQPDFQRLMKLYDEERLTILEALTANSMGRIRSMVARTFVDPLSSRSRKRPGDSSDD